MLFLGVEVILFVLSPENDDRGEVEVDNNYLIASILLSHSSLQVIGKMCDF
jgi:hypothetical protein